MQTRSSPRINRNEAIVLVVLFTTMLEFRWGAYSTLC